MRKVSISSAAWPWNCMVTSFLADKLVKIKLENTLVKKIHNSIASSFNNFWTIISSSENGGVIIFFARTVEWRRLSILSNPFCSDFVVVERKGERGVMRLCWAVWWVGSPQFQIWGHWGWRWERGGVFFISTMRAWRRELNVKGLRPLMLWDGRTCSMKKLHSLTSILLESSCVSLPFSFSIAFLYTIT